MVHDRAEVRMTTSPPVASRRERARAATTEEIKQTALQLMRDQRTTDVRLSDIAKEMGLTPPALYRYFGGREELLTALITDSYDELGAYVSASLEALPPEALWERWVAAGQAYRGWAGAAPERFTLILGMPVPGYVADEEGPTTEAAKRAMSQLSGLFAEAQRRGVLGSPLVRTVDDALAVAAAEKHPEDMEVLPPESFQAMLHAWASLHGFTTLEAYGHLDWLGQEARDAMFLTLLEQIARAAGLPTA
jgi:AcrR family transcriptional regulator